MHWGGSDGQSEPEPFPKKWADKVWNDYGAIPLIKWEPNSEPDGYLNDVTPDDPYMIQFAKDCGKAGYPIFISFAHEMNGDWHNWNNPSLFIEKWRIVHDVMEQYAPNAIMVWCASIWSANYEDNGRIDDYYPGDDYVDWVGIDMYFPYYKDADPDSYIGEFPRELILNFYDIYTQPPHSKPMMIAEWAAAKRCQSNPRLDPNHTKWPDPHTGGDGQWECEDYANERVNNLYPNLKRQFPMIKAVIWFHIWKERDWRVPNAYSAAITDKWFLSRPERLEYRFRFINNLKNNQTSDDVRYLQTFLKAQGPEIYPEGIVSGWFGPLTKNAVIRFQERYTQDILKPWELTEGTGYVGKTTRAKINEILGRLD